MREQRITSVRLQVCDPFFSKIGLRTCLRAFASHLGHGHFVAEVLFDAVVDAADLESVPVGCDVLQHFFHLAVATVEQGNSLSPLPLVSDLVTGDKGSDGVLTRLTLAGV